LRKLRVILLSLISWLAVVGVLTSCAHTADVSVSDVPFVWDNAEVYFLLTDRFNNGNTDNDHAYGRGLDEEGNVIPGIEDSEGSFHGGDFAGITQKIEDGYFTDLGITAIWITPPFEQVHGYRSGPGFAFYAYHGYWALDFTQPDANYGTEKEFRTMVDTAHKNGIRIVMDVVLNHPGYATMADAETYGFGAYDEGWKDYYYGDASLLTASAESSYMDTSSANWANWWGADWIRSSDALPGYDTGGAGDTLSCLSGLPDFKTESTEEVELPPLLVNKWTQEGRLDEEEAELDDFFTENNLPRTVLNYEIKWLTDWVREYGIDGFRCDTAKNVDPECWDTLKTYASAALEDWRKANPKKVLGDTPFWTVGEVWDHGVTYDRYFTDGSFDALINFSFRKNVMNYSILPKLYTFMYDAMAKDDFDVLSYISSHDTALFTRSNLIKGGNALLLSPGSVQVYYGDETARPTAWPDTEYADLKLRSDMNWDSIDEAVLRHWQILGQFRSRHPSVGAGTHIQIQEDPFIFARVYETGTEGQTDYYRDQIIAVIADSNTDVAIPVTGYFADGTELRNAYDGTKATAAGGSVTFSSGVNGVILVETAEQ